MGWLEIPDRIRVGPHSELEPIKSRAKNPKIIGKAGEEFWLAAKIILNKDFEYTRIRAEFEYDEEDDYDIRHYSRAGFWIGVEDKIKELMFDKELNVNKNPGISLTLNYWDFGSTPRIEFVQAKESKNKKKKVSNCEIDLVFCVVPYFNKNEKKFSDCELKLTVEGRRFHTTYFDAKDSTHKKIKFELVNNHQQTERDKLTLIDDLQGFKDEGKGMSVHPKQLVTISDLTVEIGRFNRKINISYIGTDTTENIRSIIRFLKQQNKDLIDKIGTIYVYKTENYDEPIAEYNPKLKLNEDMSDGKFKIKFEKLPKDGSLPKNIVPTDITIATYVTPWAAFGKNKSQYRKLLEKLIVTDDSILIAVDPESEENIVRSLMNPNTSYNLDGFYKDELKLKDRENNNVKSDTVRSTIWCRGGD